MKFKEYKGTSALKLCNTGCSAITLKCLRFLGKDYLSIVSEHQLRHNFDNQNESKGFGYVRSEHMDVIVDIL